MSLCLCVFVCVSWPAASALAEGAPRTFSNPLLTSGPDPWVTYRDGFYYYMHTTGRDLRIWKSRSIADLATAERRVVWTPPATGPMSRNVWAPELHYLRGKWYIYFAADDGHNENHRVWVLENRSRDPLRGSWTLKGKLADASDKWAIDATVFEHRGRLYALWSGWEGEANGRQDLYIGRLSNPWTVAGRRVMISKPTLAWETIGDVENDPKTKHLDVNEGPEFLAHGDKVFVVYSASACWTDDYALGMLTARADADLLDPASWTKSARPVFETLPVAGAFGVGHNSFFTSPDGKESWILYHANSDEHDGCGDRRSPRAQPFAWRADGTPDFGGPVPVGVPLRRPSGER